MLHFLEPRLLIEYAGLVGVIGVIFAESGLFFGFFLPGDSLLFTAGFLSSLGMLNFPLLLSGCFIAAVIGDSVGYTFGKKVGGALFTREDSFFFHKKHAERAKDFYTRYGKKAIVMARFVPIVRTFAPIIAGVGNMEYKTFLTYNVIGGALWTLGITSFGYFLGSLIPGVEKYLSYIIIGIILVSFIPVVFEYMKSRKSTHTTL